MEPIAAYSQDLDLLMEQFRNSSRLRGILEAHAAQMDKLEAAMWEVSVILNISTAEGEQLDLLGRIANIPRGGLDDAAYRALLMVWFQLRGSGTPEDIIRALKENYGATSVTYIPEYPAGFLVHAPTLTPVSQEFLNLISPAGVQALVGCFLADTEWDIITDTLGSPIIVAGPCVPAFPVDAAWDGGFGSIDPAAAVFTEPWPFRDSNGVGEYPDGGFGPIDPDLYTFQDGSWADDTGGL